MDSQSSDVFSDSGEHETSLNAMNKMDLDEYFSLVSSVKLLLSQRQENDILKTDFPGKFASVLEDCEACISQSCNLINSIMSEQALKLEELHAFMEDAIKLLQLLTCYIRHVGDTVSMACSRFGNLPTITGHIIKTVFTHCKNSEALYGNHLKSVETQLKDLFRACHELQITYLMVLEKHYTFDLNRYEEMDILLEAMKINLNIGKIVQTLDVKTMAEQWKGYTLLCEKYATCLAQRDVFYNTSKLLATIAENNIKTALEKDNDDKLSVRSLKVASFTIKILIKVCNIFKQANLKDYEHILELLLYVYLNSSPYLQVHGNKPLQFIQMMIANILPPCEVLLKELLADELFVKTVFTFDMAARRHEDKLLGYSLLIMSIIKLICQHDGHKVSGADLVNSIYKFLPYGHIWFNMGLKFDVPSPNVNRTYGLYENMLSHTYALATKLSSDDRTILQEKMIESILGLDTYSALFSANLWSLLARLYSFSPVVLGKICSACESDNTFCKRWETSPSRIHMRHFTGKLFQTLSEEHINNYFHRFCNLPLKQVNSFDACTAAKLSNLPKVYSDKIDFMVCTLVDDMQHAFKNVDTSTDEEQIHTLCKRMRMVATADLNGPYKEALLENIVKAWIKSCPNKNSVLLQCFGKDLDSQNAIFVDYFRSLAALTKSVGITSFDRVAQVKILHAVCSLIQHGNTEIKLAVMNLLFELAQKRVVRDNTEISNAILTLTFRSLFQERETLVRELFYNFLRNHKEDKCVLEIISNTIENDRSLQNICNSLWNLENDSNNWKEQLSKTLDLKFVHKCLENNISQVIDQCDTESVKLIDKANSSNFDFADIDSLFDCNDSDSEPACKKVKLNHNEVSEIVARLESESEQLCQVKENIFTQEHKCRIREVCAKLERVLQ